MALKKVEDAEKALRKKISDAEALAKKEREARERMEREHKEMTAKLAEAVASEKKERLEREKIQKDKVEGQKATAKQLEEAAAREEKERVLREKVEQERRQAEAKANEQKEQLEKERLAREKLIDGPEMPASIPDPVFCPIADEAQIGQDLYVHCVAQSQIKATGAVLYYRASGSVHYNSLAMERTKRGWYVAIVPGEKVAGKMIQFYVEARSRDGDVLSNNGKAASPNVIMLKKRLSMAAAGQ